jgi:recombination protein RecT
MSVEAPAALKRPEGRVATFRGLLFRYRDHFKTVLPRTMAPQVDRMVQVALGAISRNPTLLACEPYSVLRSLLVAAQLGLDPSGVLGQGWLVPYRNTRTGKYEAQFIIGYRGLRELARRSGDVLNVEARVVNERDEFSFDLGYDPQGSRPHLRHVPAMDGEAGQVKAAYCIVWLRGAPHPYIEIMSRAQIDKVRAASRAATSGPWVDWYEEMARKTVLRKALNYAPLSHEAARAIAAADVMESGEADVAEVLTDLPALPPLENGDGAEEAAAGKPSKTEALKERLRRLNTAGLATAAEAQPPDDAPQPPGEGFTLTGEAASSPQGGAGPER